MNKLFWGSAVLTLFCSITPKNTRAQVFPEGSNSISAGYGFVTLLGTLNRNFDIYNDVNYSSLGPLYFKYERAVSDHIGLGLSVAYVTNEWTYNYSSFDSTFNYSETVTRAAYSVLARFNYHFGSSEKLDPYIGLGLGYRDGIWSVSSSDPTGLGSGFGIPNLMPLGMELTFGMRYFFTDNIGAYMEVGGAKSVIQLGVSAKF